MRRPSLFACLLVFAVPGASALENDGAVKVTPLMKTTTSWDGKPLVYPTGQAEVSALVVEIAPGGETGWHRHPVPSFGVVLEGALEVRLEDGRVQRLERGQALAEVVGTLHNGRNVDDTPLKLLVFYAGSVGQPLTVKAATGKP
ncbi:MAG TPA: cupin domain-containing protein [Tahibacter sp.]|uniref:cupin domain-containing protein n=1 Tax=Tahibacter sp. TaxID=2056211 RepID=UPI002B5899F0|nr:cupin domain-containing protein [Tahibacter sp.]HSX60638.1 cupin domain-containing protein [Tahibacter sp.]